MDKKLPLQDKIEKTLESIDTLEGVSVSPFFKERTLNALYSQEEVQPKHVFSWFTPTVQLATLVGFVVLNSFALYSYTSVTYSENVATFAQEYELEQEDYQSIFN